MARTKVFKHWLRIWPRPTCKVHSLLLNKRVKAPRSVYNISGVNYLNTYTLRDPFPISHFITLYLGKMSPRILLFGTGNVGIIYAFILSRAGAEVTCVCRSNYESAKSNGFEINSTIFGDVSFHPTIASSVSEAVTIAKLAFDYVVVCCKSSLGSTPSTASLIAPAVTASRTSIVIIQNGLGVEREFHALFPSTPIISGVAYLPSTQVSPNSVSHAEIELLHLGNFPATPNLPEDRVSAEQFAALVTQGGATAVLHDDIQLPRWNKLVANAALNPICALSRCRDLELMSTSPVAADIMKGVMLEVTKVAGAMGYWKEINESTVEKQFARSMARQWPGVEPSMLADIRLGKKLEVEAIVGEVVRLGRQKAVKIDRLETLYALLSGLDWATQTSQSI